MSELSTSTRNAWHDIRQAIHLRTRVRHALAPLQRAIASARYRLPKDVEEAYSVYASHPEASIEGYGSMIASELDAGVLYHLVRSLRPRRALDLGAGLGTITAMVGLAMEANGEGEVLGIEHLDWMLAESEKLLPAACRGRVRFQRCETEIRRSFDRDWACYQLEAPEPFDLVIVDGPPTEREREGVTEYLPNGDLLRVLPQMRPGSWVFVDGRVPSVAAYRAHLGQYFRIETSPLDYTVMELLESVPASAVAESAVVEGH